MNSILLTIVGLLLLTAELIPAAPAPFFDENAEAALDLGDPELTFDNDLQAAAAKRSSMIQQKQCIFQCLVCSGNTNMKMMDCTNGCNSRNSSPSQMRAYHACSSYLHSGRK